MKKRLYIPLLTLALIGVGKLGAATAHFDAPAAPHDQPQANQLSAQEAVKQAQAAEKALITTMKATAEKTRPRPTAPTTALPIPQPKQPAYTPEEFAADLAQTGNATFLYHTFLPKLDTNQSILQSPTIPPATLDWLKKAAVQGKQLSLINAIDAEIAAREAAQLPPPAAPTEEEEQAMLNADSAAVDHVSPAPADESAAPVPAPRTIPTRPAPQPPVVASPRSGSQSIPSKPLALSDAMSIPRQQQTPPTVPPRPKSIVSTEADDQVLIQSDTVANEAVAAIAQGAYADKATALADITAMNKAMSQKNLTSKDIATIKLQLDQIEFNIKQSELPVADSFNIYKSLDQAVTKAENTAKSIAKAETAAATKAQKAATAKQKAADDAAKKANNIAAVQARTTSQRTISIFGKIINLPFTKQTLPGTRGYTNLANPGSSAISDYKLIQPIINRVLSNNTKANAVDRTACVDYLTKAGGQIEQITALINKQQGIVNGLEPLITSAEQTLKTANDAVANNASGKNRFKPNTKTYKNAVQAQKDAQTNLNELNARLVKENQNLRQAQLVNENYSRLVASLQDAKVAYEKVKVRIVDGTPYVQRNISYIQRDINAINNMSDGAAKNNLIDAFNAKASLNGVVTKYISKGAITQDIASFETLCNTPNISIKALKAVQDGILFRASDPGFATDYNALVVSMNKLIVNRDISKPAPAAEATPEEVVAPSETDV